MTKPPVGLSIAICLGIALAAASAFDGSATAVRAGIREVAGDEIPEPTAKDTWCDHSQTYLGDDKYTGHCEVREARIPAGRKLIIVDAGLNGGIQVKGWKQKDILVQARVNAWAASADEAKALAEEIRLVTDGAKIHATGPDAENRKNWPRWGVSFRIYAPATSDLDLEAFNGGIQIEGVSGAIRLETLNGALALRRVSGDVSGHTTNGSLAVALDGASWRGSGLELSTTNGSVSVAVPVGYSGTLETGTTNGRMDIGIKGTYSDSHRRHFRAEMGKGGAPIRVTTTNGAVYVATNPGD